MSEKRTALGEKCASCGTWSRDVEPCQGCDALLCVHCWADGLHNDEGEYLAQHLVPAREP